MRSFVANAFIFSAITCFPLLPHSMSAQEKKQEDRPRLFKGGLIKRIEEMQEKIKKDREERQKEREKKELEKKRAEAARKKKKSSNPSTTIPASSSRRGTENEPRNTPLAPQLEPIPALDESPNVGMGIEVRSRGLSANGLIIEVVDKGGPADRAGLKVDDRITSVGGSTIKKNEDLRLIMSAFEPGDRTEVEFVRDGKKQSTLLEFPGSQPQAKKSGGLALNAPQKNAPQRNATSRGGTEELPNPNQPALNRQPNKRAETPLANSNSTIPILPLQNENSKEFRSGIGVTAVAVDPLLFARQKLSVRQGAFLDEVSKGSAAEKAGLKTGDVVIALDGRKIDSAVGMAELVQSYRPGEKAQLLYYRGNRLMRTEIKMDAIPASEMEFPTKPVNPVSQTARNNSPNRNSILGELSKEFPRLRKVEDLIEKFGGNAETGQPENNRPLNNRPLNNRPLNNGRTLREIELENEVNSLRNQLKGQNRQIEDLTEKLNLIERLLKNRK